jgi:hypothetical protein
VYRYLCRNKDCQHRTFSIHYTDTLPYCRFLLPDLGGMDALRSSSSSIHDTGRRVNLSRAVVRRVWALLSRTHDFLSGLCREITDGENVSGLEQMLQTAQEQYCCMSLQAMWFRAIYRFGP